MALHEFYAFMTKHSTLEAVLRQAVKFVLRLSLFLSCPASPGSPLMQNSGDIDSMAVREILQLLISIA